MWDDNSGIRERLALLAALGPTMQPAQWGYNPARDSWYRCAIGMGPAGPVKAIAVRQEGSASLAILLDKWRMDRVTAMAVIGHVNTAGYFRDEHGIVYRPDLDWPIDEDGDLLCYCGTRPVANDSQIETLFIRADRLTEDRRVSEEEARAIHPALFEHLAEVNAGRR